MKENKTGERKTPASLDREIWRLLWPLLLLTLVSRIGLAFEGVLVSVNNADELTVSGICAPYITIITTINFGLGIAANSLTGRLKGEALWDSCCRRATRLLTLVLVGCGYVTSLFSALLLRGAFAETPELLSLGFRYMLPYLFGSPFIIIANTLTFALRGLGDTKSGMWITFATVPVQISVAFLGYKFFGLAGLGYGAVSGDLVGSIIGYCLYRRYFPSTGGREALPAGMGRDFFRLAIPVSLSKVVSPAATAAINALILTIGSEHVAVSGLGWRLEYFFYMPAMLMGSIAITLTAQNKGKLNMKKLAAHLCLWSLAPTLLLVLGAFFFREPIWALLTPDETLRAAGVAYWRICLWAYPLIALEMTTTGILQALGCGMPALVVTLVRTWGVQFTVTALAVRLGWGADGAWMAFLLGNLASILTSAAWAWKKVREQNLGSEETT